MATAGLRVNVLGAITITIDGDVVDVSRKQVRLLLALFAVAGASPTTADRLIEHLWADELPSDPAASLRVALSRLRSLLGPTAEALVSLPTGYVLEAESDVDQFEHLRECAAQASSPEESVQLLSNALALWVGDEPFGEFADRPLLNDAAQQLELSRLAARVLFARQLHALGREREAVDLTLPLHRSDPANEELTLVVAAALADCGRRAEALNSIEATRKHLRDRIGIEPSSALVELELELLRGARGLVPAASANERPPNEGPFVGRTAEIQRLLSAPSDSWLIKGNPGSGKSRLVDEFATRLGAAGIAMHHGDAIATARHPMQALTELLSSVANEVPRSEWSDSLTAALLRLAPELVVDARSVSAPESREALLAQCVEALATHAPRGQAVLVIDDFQWIDRASANVVAELIRTDRCSVTMASRPNFPTHAREAVDCLGYKRELAMDPLTLDECVDYVRTRLQHVDADKTGRAVHERCGGNPLFLGLLTDLIDEGISTADGLPANILIAVHERVSQLPSATQRALEAASIFPSNFDVAVIEQLSGAGSADIEIAVASGLLREVDGVDELEFEHSLVAEATYQLLSEGQKLNLHDEAGRLLEDLGQSPAEFVVHTGAAVSIDPHRAVRTHLLAAEEFAQGFDWEIALMLADRAAEFADSFNIEDAFARSDAAVLRGSVLRSMGDPSGDEDLLHGVELALGASEFRVAANGLIALCSHPRFASEHGPKILDWVERVLGESLPSTITARLCAAASTLVASSPKQELGRQRYRQALELAKGSGDRATIIEVLLRLNLGAPSPFDFELRLSGAARLRELANSDPDCLWEAAFLDFGSGLVLSDEEMITTNLKHLRELTPTLRMKRRDFGLSFCEAAYQKYLGDLDAADALVDQTMEAGRQLYTESWMISAYAALLAAIREAQGRLHELLPLIDAQLESGEDRPAWHALAAAGATSQGDADRTRNELAFFHECDFDVPHEISYTGLLSLLVEPVELVADKAAARRLLELTEPLAGRMLWNGLVTHRPADEAIARYAQVAG